MQYEFVKKYKSPETGRFPAKIVEFLLGGRYVTEVKLLAPEIEIEVISAQA